MPDWDNIIQGRMTLQIFPNNHSSAYNDEVIKLPEGSTLSETLRIYDRWKAQYDAWEQVVIDEEIFCDDFFLWFIDNIVGLFIFYPGGIFKFEDPNDALRLKLCHNGKKNKVW